MKSIFEEGLRFDLCSRPQLTAKTIGDAVFRLEARRRILTARFEQLYGLDRFFPGVGYFPQNLPAALTEECSRLPTAMMLR